MFHNLTCTSNNLLHQTSFISSVTKLSFLWNWRDLRGAKTKENNFSFTCPFCKCHLFIYIRHMNLSTLNFFFLRCFFFFLRIYGFSQNLVLYSIGPKRVLVFFLLLSFSSSYSSKLLKSWPLAISLSFRNSFTWHGKWRRPWPPC